MPKAGKRKSKVAFSCQGRATLLCAIIYLDILKQTKKPDFAEPDNKHKNKKEKDMKASKFMSFSH